jgi:hypothetical protein
MDVKQLFLSLTDMTYPHGYEEMLEEFLPLGTRKDKHGNYFYQIGNSRTVFTCHLDTASYTHGKVNHVFDLNYIRTDGTSILGADDKAGMTVLLYMIHRKVPGTYYFFIGEERGCIGSRAAARDKSDFTYYDRMISFDRRGTTSVITHQSSRRSCSDKFAQELSDRLSIRGLSFRPDDTGVYTDSAEFVDVIPECTNISVGYNKEHTNQESQNIEFLEKLCEVCAVVDFETLPTHRDPTKYEYKSYDYGSASGRYYHDTFYGAGYPPTKKNKKGRRGGRMIYPDDHMLDYGYNEQPDYYWVNGRKVYYSDSKQNKRPDSRGSVDTETTRTDKYAAIRDMYLSGDLTKQELNVIKNDIMDMSDESDRDFYDYMFGVL